MKTQTKRRVARGCWAVFEDKYDYGQIERAKVPIHFWEEDENGELHALILGKEGLVDPKKFSNFLEFSGRQLPA